MPLNPSRNRLLRLLFCQFCGLLLAGCVQLQTPPAAQPTTPAPLPTADRLPLPPGFDVQGHRGARGLKPENTLPSFEAALDVGVTTLELDLHFSADDALIVWHDDTITPEKCQLIPAADSSAPDPDDPSTPPAQLRVRSLTVAQLRQYRCHRNPDPDRFPQQNSQPTALAGDDFHIPTLPELFEFVDAYAASAQKTPAQRENARRVQFNIETKRRADRPAAIADGFDGVNPGPFEQALAEIVQRRGLTPRVVVQSFDHRSLWAIRKIAPDLRLAPLLSRPEPLEPLARKGAAIVSPRASLVTPGQIEAAHSLGLKLIPWTVNDPAEMTRLIAMGVDGLITDRPDLLLQIARLAPRATAAQPVVDVFAEGFLGPVGLAPAPGGGLFVAEEGTGTRDESAGVSFIRPDGSHTRLISGLPSSRDAGDLAGVPLVAYDAPRQLLYTANFGQGHLWRLDVSGFVADGQFVPPAQPLTPGDLEPVMTPLNNVRLTNPFDLTFDATGAPIVSDASENGLARPTADGRTRFFHRFAPLPFPDGSPDTIDPVPTGIEILGAGEYAVTLTGGCPYPAGGGRLVAVDEARNQRTLIAGLDMPIDISRGPDGTLWLLEFARFAAGASCFTGQGYLRNSGRLSRVGPDWTLEPVLTGLDTPGAVLAAGDGGLFISEVFSGRVLRVEFSE